MTHAYNQLYLNKCSRNVANMLNAAVILFGYDLSDYLDMFVRSNAAREIENGNPFYIAGKSGLELYSDVMRDNGLKEPDLSDRELYDRSEVYWIGWALARYQWYSGRSFAEIIECIPADELLRLYSTLHEADIQKVYEIFDSHFEMQGSNLKKVRRLCGLTQEELSEISGVSINTIRAYERKSKDINKAQANILFDLSKALKCPVNEILN